jgi:hypothetical protein
MQMALILLIRPRASSDSGEGQLTRGRSAPLAGVRDADRFPDRAKKQRDRKSSSWEQ